MMMKHDEAKDFCEDNLEEDLKTLTPKDRLNFYLSLLEYFHPKQNRINFESDNQLDKIEIVNATGNNKSLPRDMEEPGQD